MYKKGSKFIGAILLTLTLIIFVLSATASVGVKEYGIDRDGKTTFFNSVFCERVTRAYNNKVIFEYFIPLLRSDLDASGISRYEKYFSIEHSNYFFTIKDDAGNVLLSNYQAEYGYALTRIFEVEEVEYEMQAFVKEDITAKDDYMPVYKAHMFLQNAYSWFTPIAVISFILSIAIFSYLVYTAGKKSKDEKAKDFASKIPFDLFTLLVVAFIAGLIYLAVALFKSELVYSIFVQIMCGFVACIFFAALGAIIWFFSLVSHIKQKTLIKNTLIAICIRWVFRLIKKIFSLIPLLWKAALVASIFILFDLILMLSNVSPKVILFYFLFRTGLAIFAFLIILDMNKLKKAGQAIADGNLAYVSNASYLIHDFKKHADNLSSIQAGISAAVSEKMKSERFKNELITNVSHDIKTPLTSIINYTDLLDKTDITDEAAKEYIEILKKQGSRLKKLIDDLIEASKASSGSMKLNLESINVKEVVTQSLAEYGERFKANSIEYHMEGMDELYYIKADGRLLWRVLDNVLENICKYSLENTRVYVTSEKDLDKIKICFKNISKEKLEISGQELTERFVRADLSRNTEGSGLGLAIAKSLTELMGGDMVIETDGDLFKACFLFKVALPSKKEPDMIIPKEELS